MAAYVLDDAAASALRLRLAAAAAAAAVAWSLMAADGCICP
jgi:hypothetical protein